ncbi:MAG: hypothetical protein JEY91_03985 [Spirochaetaceae bacterium]|nr:hypothetical protein [Spirochaetaceae bacterium]
MDHFTSFILLLAIAFSAASIALAIWFRIQYHHQASIWFAAAIAGLGSFLIEILIFRYGNVIKPVVSELMYNTIISFSNIWALIGGLLVSIALPRLALLRTGAANGFWWHLFLFSPPVLTFIFGVLYLLGFFPLISGRFLQFLIFFTPLLSVLIILIKSLGEQKIKNRIFLRRIGILSVIFIPFVFIDAIGIQLPIYLNDLSLAFYVSGICLISIFEVQNLFGKPTLMENNKISNYFFEHYRISSREKDVVELVISGDSNSLIGEKLFISEKTVENHLTSILRKTEVKNRIELFRLIHSSRD